MGPAVLALLALVLLLFHDAVFRQRIFFERDIHAYWWGQAEVFVRCISSGSWPVWDPYTGFGQPFLANPSTQVLYPWTWLSLLVSPMVAYTIYVVAHSALATLGVFALGRRLQMSRAGAFFAAAVWLLSGPLLSFVNLWHHFAGIAWMPWVLLAADRLIETPTVARALVLGIAFGGQLLAGSAEMCLLAALFAIAWMILSIPRRDLRSNLRLLGACGVALGFAIALSAAQWLPTFDYASKSGRAALTPAMRTYWSLHPIGLAQAVVPVLPQNLPLDPSLRTALFDGPDPFVASVYLGLTTLPLVLSGFLAGPRRSARFFAVAVFVAFGVALGRHSVLYSAASWLLPPLRALRYPSKVVILAALAWALLLGLGFDAWNRGLTRRQLSLALTVCGVFSGLLWLGVLLTGSAAEGWAPSLFIRDAGASYAAILAPTRHVLAVTGGLSTIACVLVAAQLRPAWVTRRAALAALLGSISIADLFYVNAGLNPTAPREVFATRPPTFALGGEGPTRIFAFDYVDVAGKTYKRPRGSALLTWPVDPQRKAEVFQAYPLAGVAKRWGVYGSYDLDPLVLFPPHIQSLGFILRASEETPGFLRLLRMGGVQHVVALHAEGLEDLAPEAVVPGPLPQPIRIFGVPGTLPRTYVVARPRVAPGRRALEALAVPGFDPAQEVLLDEAPLPEPEAPFSGRSTLLELKPDRVRLSAQLDEPGYVVLVDTYDPGWRATLDGKGVPILRANVGFRAVAAPAGSHIIEFVYRPRVVLVGLLISGVAALIGAGVALQRLRRLPAQQRP